MPCLGARLHHFAAQQITVPHGIYAGVWASRAHGVEDDEEEEAEEDRWPTLGQALRHSIASLDVGPREAYDAYDCTERESTIAG